MAEVENASDVRHGRQMPRQQSQTSAWTSEQIALAQLLFDEFLLLESTDDELKVELTRFLLHVGYLMGYSEPLVEDENDEIESTESEIEMDHGMFLNKF
jgi:hypothetical protein